MLPEKSLKQLTRQSLQQSLEVNLFSVAFYLQALLPWLQKPPGIKVAVLSAKVGSISDNRLGGWYSYRMAKAALNMLVKCSSIELGRFNKTAVLFSLHPGTTDSALSAPFQQNLPAGQLKTAADTAHCLLATIRTVSVTETGLLLNWDGQVLDF
jgi:NAD(P)-dependent dehydrogenase (short-subunit alcohol dehydrogenase family)